MDKHRHLTREEVVSIKRWYAAGFSVYDIAQRSGVSRVSVRAIVNGRTHKRVRAVDERSLPPLPRRREDQQRRVGKRPSPAELARYATRRR